MSSSVEWRVDRACDCAARRDHVWPYDFGAVREHDGRPLRLLTIVDEYTRECLAIDVARRLTSEDVMARLTELFAFRGIPDHIRSDDGSEPATTVVREWLARLCVKTLYIDPGSPWENGYCESLNGKLRDEFLNGEIFETLHEARSSSRAGAGTRTKSDPTARWNNVPPPPPAKLPAGTVVAPLLRLPLQSRASGVTN